MTDAEKTNENQRKFWKGNFGNNYIERNSTIEEVNEIYQKETGKTIEDIFQFFFNEFDRNYRVIELGCNVGLNLSILQKMGFKNLFGVEINKNAYEIAKKRNPAITFINSSIEDFLSDNKYDVVFTAGVLIHVNPRALNSIINKIVTLTEKYIFGFEYYADALTEVTYRDHSNVCWKQNFPFLFKQLHPTIKITKEEKIHYLNKNLTDIAYLLEINSG